MIAQIGGWDDFGCIKAENSGWINITLDLLFYYAFNHSVNAFSRTAGISGMENHSASCSLNAKTTR